MEKKDPFGTNPCSSTSFLISESSISHAAKGRHAAKNEQHKHWGNSAYFSSRPLPMIPVALVPLHELVTEVFIGDRYLILEADEAGRAPCREGGTASPW